MTCPFPVVRTVQGQKRTEPCGDTATLRCVLCGDVCCRLHAGSHFSPHEIQP